MDSMGDILSAAHETQSMPSTETINISQSLVWTHARSIATSRPRQAELGQESERETTQNVCLLFAKIAAEAALPCISITDYDTSDPLGSGLSFEVAGMDISPQAPWYRESLFQGGPSIAVKRIRAGRIDDEATASRLRPLLQSIILELQILTHPAVRRHENIVPCLAAGYQHFSYDNTYLLPLIVLQYTNWTTLANHEIHLPPFGMGHKDKVNCLVDVARALRFLHGLGITHGDVKGSNVLVFYLELEARQIVGMERFFMAKITDFGCAHLNDGRDARLPGWTPLWAAPEVNTVIAADLIHKTDIYSYGLLVCYVVLDQDFHEIFDLKGDRFEQTRSLDILKRSGRLLEQAERAMEKKKLSKSELFNILQVLRCTLQRDPSSRTLETIEDFLPPKHGKVPKQSRSTEASSPRIQLLAEVDDLSLLLSTYEDRVLYPSRFFDCDWSVQTYVFRHLVCEWENDGHSKTRRGHAAFQLCICYLNGFGVRASNIKAAEYLALAVSSQHKHAQHLFYRLQKHLSPNFIPNSETIEWLVDGMSGRGIARHMAAQDLATLDPERYRSMEAELSSTHRISSCMVGNIRLDFADLEGLQQSIHRLPQPHDSILTSYHNKPLLHTVVASGYIDAATLLVDTFNLDVNLYDELGETPLIVACQASNLGMVKLLISKGARYLSNSREKISPLHYLLRFHEEEVDEVANLVSKAGYPIDMNIEKSHSPLFWAASRRALREVPTGISRSNISAVKALLKLGAEIYPTDSSDANVGEIVRRTATLHDLELLQVLLNATSRRDARKIRPLRWVLDAKTLTTFERIVYTRPEMNARLQETVDLALQYEKDIDKINGFGENALFFAIARGNARIVRHLLKTKCREQLDVPSGRHMLHPLLLAVSLNAEDIVEILLRAGADISSTFGDLEETCFHLCSRKSGSIEIADLLFKHSQCYDDERGRLFDKPRKDQRTPYHLAVYQGHFKLADWYAARGANVEATLPIVTWNTRGMRNIFV